MNSRGKTQAAIVLAIVVICGGLAFPMGIYTQDRDVAAAAILDKAWVEADTEALVETEAGTYSDIAVKTYDDLPCVLPDCKYPDINAGAAVVIDSESGRILYEKNALSKRAMASTTKMITAILAIENADIDDEVTISRRAALIGGSTGGYRAGQIVSLNELLFALMLASANDAAIAIAEHVGGTVENFCRMMDRKADEAGAKRTSFKSPHGLDSPGHFSTAYDLAMIANYALQNPVFAELVSTKSIQLEYGSYYNTNDLLGYYEGMDGVKTGYTGKAGRCLVTSAKRDGQRLISVVLNSPTRTARAESTRKILDYCFCAYKPYTLLESGDITKKIPVRKGLMDIVALISADDCRLPLREDEAEDVRAVVDVPAHIDAPVHASEDIGRIRFLLGDEELASYPLKASWTVERKLFIHYLGDFFTRWITN